MIGVVGSGYIAAIMPPDLIAAWIGPNSGFIGILIATIVGAATPGGAVVGFAIGAAALKSGAGAPQVIAYYDRLVALHAPAAAQLGNPHDGAALRVAARGGVVPAADPGRLGALLIGKP